MKVTPTPSFSLQQLCMLAKVIHVVISNQDNYTS